MMYGNGPWFIVSLYSETQNTYKIHVHTYAYKVAAWLNRIENSDWITKILVGPFDSIHLAKECAAYMTTNDNIPNTFKVRVWKIKQVLRPPIVKKHKGKELTLDMLDGKITVGIVRLMRNKRIKL